MKLSSKHRRTLRAVFSRPVRADVLWRDVEKLMAALGAELTHGRGSRIRVHLSGVRATFHRPHPQKETGRGALRSVQRFLREAGVDTED